MRFQDTQVVVDTVNEEGKRLQEGAEDYRSRASVPAWWDEVDGTMSMSTRANDDVQ